MGIYEELVARGLIAQVTDEEQIRELVTEMLDAEQKWLPNFEGRRPRPTPTVAIPDGLIRAKVPADPALAISTRLASL